MSRPGERNHKNAEHGVAVAQRWLNSTAQFEVLWTVYDNEIEVSPTLLRQCHSYDLTGKILSDNRRFFAEVKTHTYANDQSKEFRRFLGKSYSSLASLKLRGFQPDFDFMWITWHPFDQKKWRVLCSKATIYEALKADGAEYIPDGYTVDDDLVAELARKLWLVVMSDRQEELIMPDKYLAMIRSHLVNETR